jgi:hypothetical protein
MEVLREAAYRHAPFRTITRLTGGNDIISSIAAIMSAGLHVISSSRSGRHGFVAVFATRFLLDARLLPINPQECRIEPTSSHATSMTL